MIAITAVAIAAGFTLAFAFGSCFPFFFAPSPVLSYSALGDCGGVFCEEGLTGSACKNRQTFPALQVLCLGKRQIGTCQTSQAFPFVQVPLT